MSSDRKHTQSNSIPIRFLDGDEASALVSEGENSAEQDSVVMIRDESGEESYGREGAPKTATSEHPASAESITEHSEVKRLQSELAEALDVIARRQADFENYRKRIERERGEAYTRIVSDIARKLLPVLDNFGRALDAERLVEGSESKEFRHFLHGVELIGKQLSDVLESLGVEPIPAVGERFNPYVHEAVVTEPSDEYEPDTVIQEMTRGYRIGDKLVRPAVVKVAAKRQDS
jgi:molecular chaperone GrpE